MSIVKTESRKHTESHLQKCVIDWFKLAYRGLGLRDYRLLYANTNGAFLGGGVKGARRGFRLKEEGMTAGVPDLFLAVARNEHHGLYIELKTKTGTVSDAQHEMYRLLSEQGYEVITCYGLHGACDTIVNYLKIKT